jgi:hypothetical protein
MWYIWRYSEINKINYQYNSLRIEQK